MFLSDYINHLNINIEMDISLSYQEMLNRNVLQFVNDEQYKPLI